jgi:hypothetical protein
MRRTIAPLALLLVVLAGGAEAKCPCPDRKPPARHIHYRLAPAKPKSSFLDRNACLVIGAAVVGAAVLIHNTGHKDHDRVVYVPPPEKPPCPPRKTKE